MIWLLLFIVIAGYIVAMRKEIIMCLKLYYEKLKDLWKELIMKGKQ